MDSTEPEETPAKEIEMSSQAGDSVTRYEPKPLVKAITPSESFVKKCLVGVADLAELSLQRRTLAEQMSAAKTWAIYLAGVVPEEDLLDSFQRAFRDHATSFAINAMDVKLAYDRTLADRDAERKQLEIQERKNCRLCNGMGLRKPVDDNPYAAGRRCNHRPARKIECDQCHGVGMFFEKTKHGASVATCCPHPEINDDYIAVDSLYTHPLDGSGGPIREKEEAAADSGI